MKIKKENVETEQIEKENVERRERCDCTNIVFRVVLSPTTLPETRLYRVISVFQRGCRNNIRAYGTSFN